MELGKKLSIAAAMNMMHLASDLGEFIGLKLVWSNIRKHAIGDELGA